MAVVYRCVGILTVDVVVFFFRSPGVFHSQHSFPSTFRPRLWETSSGVFAVGVFAAEARRESLSHLSKWSNLFSLTRKYKNTIEDVTKIYAKSLSKDASDLEIENILCEHRSGNIAVPCYYSFPTLFTLYGTLARLLLSSAARTVVCKGTVPIPEQSGNNWVYVLYTLWVSLSYFPWLLDM